MATAISKKYGFIFTHIPKTGGTSIFSRRTPLKHREEFKYVKLSSGHVRLCNLKVDISRYFKFTIVRNPWDRAVSLWLTRKTLNVTFGEYLLRLLNREESTNFVATQSYWVSDDAGNLLIDKFYRYENYEEVAKEIYKKFLDVDLKRIPRLRETKRMRDYKMYYLNYSQIDLVRRIYKKDIENFNYEF